MKSFKSSLFIELLIKLKSPLRFLSKLFSFFVNKRLSFDNNLEGDFDLKDNTIKKSFEKNFIYTGCQILNRDLFKKYKICNFSISEIWTELLRKNKLNGFESFNKFYHLTNLETFNKLKDF